MQAELARALGDRGDKAAVPKLLQLARNGPESARKAALKALALLADEPQMASLVNLVTEAKEEAARSEAATAHNAVCQHMLTKRGRVNVEPLVKTMANCSPEARVALLPVCSGLNDPRVRSALRTGLADSLPQIRAAAIRALCDRTDAELLGDLLKVACEAPEENLRSLAIRGCVRVTTQEESVELSNSERVAVLKAILATPLRDDQKRVVLAGLAEIPDLEALKLVEPLLDDAAVQSEAAQAVIKIAPGLPDAQAHVASTLLRKVLITTTDVSTRQTAEAALKQIEARADFITSWQMAGPYRQAGKDYAALFGIVFPLLVPAIVFVSRFLPDGLYNIPHHDYWFAPRRRAETKAYLFRHSLWYASLALCFVIGIHFSIIHSNHSGQPQLSLSGSISFSRLFSCRHCYLGSEHDPPSQPCRPTTVRHHPHRAQKA